MTEYIHLIGAEDVRRAASAMQEAADTFSRAVASLDDANRRHQQIMEDWLARFASAIDAMKEPSRE